MIEVQNLTKRYGDKLAVDNISFSVREGEVLGFLGPNGAGKTTTMNMITGYLSSTQGTVTVDGHEILEAPLEVKRRIGYLPEQPPLYLDMTVEEYLHFLYRLKRVKGDRTAHIAEICRRTGIESVYRRLIKNLSKGYRQRVGLAQALLGSPPVLILDEPTVGLDPKQIIDIRALIKQLGKQHTVILSSHILPEVQAVCDRILVINGGRLMADDTPRNLSRRLGARTGITVSVEGPREPVLRLLQSLPGVREVRELAAGEGRSFAYELLVEKEADVRREMFRRLADRGWPILDLQVNQLSLEEVFLQLTSQNSAESTLQDTGGAPPADEDTILYNDADSEASAAPDETDLPDNDTDRPAKRGDQA